MSFSTATHSPRKNGKCSHRLTGTERLELKKPVPPSIITGTVKYFDRLRCNGWISPAKGGRAIFFEIDVAQSIELKLKSGCGQKVQFKYEQDQKDPNRWVVVDLKVISG